MDDTNLESKKEPCCSFCNAYEKEVPYIISGPQLASGDRVFVCSNCIEIMVDVIREKEPNFCFGKVN